MNLPPILAALRKHKSGVTLITLQIALTLAIVCNAVFIIGQRVERINRPTGMNEQNLFFIQQMYVHAPTGDSPTAINEIDAMRRADLATLRGLPDVEDATAINSLPLLESSDNGGIGLKPNQQNSTANTTFYFGGTQMLKTLGLQLIAGRDFTSTEITHRGFRATGEPPMAIVTKALADKLFPHGGALGKTVYLNGTAMPTTIIGIIARLQVPSSSTINSPWYSTLLPVRLDASYTRVAVRAKPGRMAAAMRESRKALLASNPMRVISGVGEQQAFVGVQPYSAIRARAYRADVGMAILMGVICVILLCITGAGIVGLTSFWVGQRRKQIGIRRALGATRHDILRYFQTENLIIAGGGVVLGAILAVGLNLWMMQQFQMHRMSLIYVLVGVVVLLLLGQGAVFAPALRASKVSPVEATRSV